MNKDKFIIDLKPIYEYINKMINEENEGYQNNDYVITLKNYNFLIDAISDYFFDNKIYEKIKERIIKMGSDKE